MKRLIYFLIFVAFFYLNIIDSEAQKKNTQSPILSQYELYKPTERISGKILEEKLKGRKGAGVELLNYLMSHQDEIPEYWQHYFGIAFWGARYTDDVGRCVRYLRWKNKAWSADPETDWNILDGSFDTDEPILILKEVKK